MRAGPKVGVAPMGFRPSEPRGHWLGTWQVRNDGTEPLTLLSAWEPHGRFRAVERSLSDAPVLEPSESLELVLPVAFDETPGTEVENAFLILRLLERNDPWRVLARLTARAEPDGGLSARVEIVTTQRVGFSADLAG